MQKHKHQEITTSRIVLNAEKLYPISDSDTEFENAEELREQYEEEEDDSVDEFEIDTVDIDDDDINADDKDDEIVDLDIH